MQQGNLHFILDLCFGFTYILDRLLKNPDSVRMEWGFKSSFSQGNAFIKAEESISVFNFHALQKIFGWTILDDQLDVLKLISKLVWKPVDHATNESFKGLSFHAPTIMRYARMATISTIRILSGRLK